MRKRRVLAFFMALSVLTSTVFPSMAAGQAEDVGQITVQETPEENPDLPKETEDSDSDTPQTEGLPEEEASGSEEETSAPEEKPETSDPDSQEPSDPNAPETSETPDTPSADTGEEPGTSPSETPDSSSGTPEGTDPDSKKPEDTVSDPETAEDTVLDLEGAEDAVTPEDGINPVTEGEEETEEEMEFLSRSAGDLELLADFDFENLSDGQEITSGNAKAVGGYTLADSYAGGGKALHLDGSAGQFLTVTDANGDSLLTGLTEMTISYEAEHERTATNWVMYAAADGNAQVGGSERYVGIMQNGGTLNAERFLNGRPADVYSAAVGNAWAHVDVVLTETDTAIYVNGVEKFRSGTTRKLPDILGTGSILQIGKANWGGGEYCQAKIDNFRIYNQALTDEQIRKQYEEYANQGVTEYQGNLTLNAGYVSEDLVLPTEYDGASVSWQSDNESAISSAGKVTRTNADQNVKLTATITAADSTSTTKEFPLVVLADGPDAATYVSSDPAIGQDGGMKIALEDGEGFHVLHRDQPVLYSKTGAKSYVSPQVFRRADGKPGMIASDGGTGTVLLYDTEDLITYTNERSVALPGIKGIEKLYCVYDMADQIYRIFVGNTAGSYIVTTTDFQNFQDAQKLEYSFADLTGPADALWCSGTALRKTEADRLEKKFTNPYNTAMEGLDQLPSSVTVPTGATAEQVQTALGDLKVKAKYSDGTERELALGWSQADLERINTSRPGTYTLHGTIGGSVYYTEADAPLIEERADPFITWNPADQYYYFTASYPMMRDGDPEGYDRLVLRRAKTISGLASAEEVTIWDESESNTLGRFIWAPELHKIGGSWYFISTAGLNTGTGTTFDIRPFMIKCNNENDMMNPASWGEPELVKPKTGDERNCLAVMSLDMTYFEAGGRHYLAWADKTQGNLSNIYIVTIDPQAPTQLTSNCSIITTPEYGWERVNIPVNEGPAVLQKDGTVYLAFSASATGSEYCVGLLTGDATDDLTNPANWTKLPYPVLSSADFDNEVSGPGHNSFTVDQDGQPVIVYHGRPAKTHASHGGDPLVDPCRHCYVKPVFFDSDGMPVLNISDEEYAGSGGSQVTIQLVVDGEPLPDAPILEYDFNEDYEAGTAVDQIGGNDAELSEGAVYVQDEKYGQVLYLDGDKAVGGSNSFLEFPEGFFDGKDSLTISMDVKEVTRSGNYFTFAIGQDNQKYLFLKTMPTYLKLAITDSSSGGEKSAEKRFKYPNNSFTWINVKMVITPTSIVLYQDGKQVAIKKSTGIRLSDLGTGLKAYLGRSFYGADQYFRGYFDNVKVYDWAMTDEEVKKLTDQEAADREAQAKDVQRVADHFVIPNAENIKGNISLPSEKNGVSIRWSSDREDVIHTEAVSGNGYVSAPAGVVTRQAEDTGVTLTAVFSGSGKSVTKTYPVTVKAAPQEVGEEDYVGYLFVHFTGTEEDGTKEQTYFSVSEDGLHWEDLNKNQPVLTSTFGESGLRDHFIARSAEGDRFYMIATDLSIANNKTNAWPEAGGNGSHSIVVWESDDLVNWSEPWMAEIAPEGAGCTWAPEFIYDAAAGEYVVYWSATTLKVDGNENIIEDYENHAIYYCKTRDFRTFTETELYHKGEGIKVIDSTMIEHNGTYYRYTKNETKGTIEIDKSDAVLGSFTEIPSQTLSTDLFNAKGAVEGPIIFKMNERTGEGKEQWCLLVDRFARGEGYYPLLTTDLESGEFTMLDDGSFSMPSKYRHGYVMPVTEQEYTALQKKWGDPNYDLKKVLEKSTTGNPMLGFDENGDILYGGDPSILVDGDTVYCYVGRDTAAGEYYQMPGWYCYSSKDMESWTFEGEILRADRAHITWAKDDVSAWAGQVVKGSNGKYYFYYCTETIAQYGGGKSIGVAVSDSPTGPFADIGHPLVRNTDTYNSVHGWEDIDPTFWLETDENGTERRYLGWGNTRFFVCELNEDMISVKDRDGDPNRLTCGYASDGTFDIVVGKMDGNGVGAENKVWFDGHFFTEAPYYYRQQNADGSYYGPYYMFFACDWREQMAYATTDDIMSNEWKFGGIIMEPSATANTNHMAVFDFKGSTYFVYHDGSLPHGSGFRRVACVEKIEINSDGSIDPIRKTATGLTGMLSTITDRSGNYVAIRDFTNPLEDSFYPITGKDLLVDFYQSGVVAQWEINPGKSNPEKDDYISLESNAKPGLYITAGDLRSDGTIPLVLSQDARGTDDEALRMTFRTRRGTAGDGVMFESVKYPGYYMVSRGGKPVLVQNPAPEEVTFYVSTDEAVKEDGGSRPSGNTQKTVRFYTEGEALNTDDIRIRIPLDNGTKKEITEYTTNADEIDMSTAGGKTLRVTYEHKGKTYTDEVGIYVVEAEYRGQ